MALPEALSPAIQGQAARSAPAGASDAHAELHRVARELEASFLEHMLKHAGYGEARESFGGGVGEAQFASMLRSEHARAITEAGGIGLAESIFNSLAARAEGDTG